MVFCHLVPDDDQGRAGARVGVVVNQRMEVMRKTG